jgi:hypothetical protein
MLAIGAFLVGGALHADPTGPRTLTFEEIESANISVGELIRVSGSYLELLDDEVQLFGSPVTFMIRRPVPRRTLLAISAERRNVSFDAIRTKGTADGDVSEQLVFEVIRVAAAPESKILFASEIEHLKTGGAANSDLLFLIAERAIKTAVRFKEPELKRLASRACVEAIRLQDASLDSADAVSRLTLANRSHDITADTRLTVELLADLDARFPQHDPIRQRLHALKSRRFRGRWMTYDEFKSLQGFEKHGTVWVSSREKDFLETIFLLQTGEQDLIIRRRTAAEYGVIASRGEAASGMHLEEVFQAFGYADRVYHRQVAGKTYKQWVYDERYCYFENGKLRRVAPRKRGN